LDPYFSILDHLQKAVRANEQIEGEIQGNWTEAIRYAYDGVRVFDWSSNPAREMTYSRTYEVAKAAKRLQGYGFRVVQNNGSIALEPESETKLIAHLERVLAAMGGLNVARRRGVFFSR
jgi:hypothetical protein